LEASAAAGLVAIEPFLAARRLRGDAIADAVHVVWTTGGSLDRQVLRGHGARFILSEPGAICSTPPTTECAVKVTPGQSELRQSATVGGTLEVILLISRQT